MGITLFTIFSTFVWSSLLIVLLYILRKKMLFLDLISVTGILSIYIFCLVRLIFPVEFPWTKVIEGGPFWNSFQRLMQFKILSKGKYGIDIYNLFILVWIVVAIIRISKLLINYRRFGSIIDNMPKESLDNERIQHKGIALYKSECIESPCAVGIIKKAIIIPDKEYTKEQEYFILMHELAHHQNKDLLVKFYTNIICALYWWNPFVNLLKKDINQSLEIKSDQTVICDLDNSERANYLDTILNELRCPNKNSTINRNYAVALSDSEKASLYERFILVARRNRCPALIKKILAMLIIVFSLVISYAFVVQSSFECPIMESEEDAYYFSEDDSYILVGKEGRYYLISSGRSEEIMEQEAIFLIEQGFEVEKVYEE